MPESDGLLSATSNGLRRTYGGTRQHSQVHSGTPIQRARALRVKKHTCQVTYLRRDLSACEKISCVACCVQSSKLFRRFIAARGDMRSELCFCALAPNGNC